MISQPSFNFKTNFHKSVSCSVYHINHMCSLNDSIQIQYFLAPHISFILLSYMDVWCLEEVRVSLLNKVFKYAEMSHSHMMVHLFLVIYTSISATFNNRLSAQYYLRMVRSITDARCHTSTDFILLVQATAAEEHLQWTVPTVSTSRPSTAAAMPYTTQFRTVKTGFGLSCNGLQPVCSWLITHMDRYMWILCTCSCWFLLVVLSGGETCTPWTQNASVIQQHLSYQGLILTQPEATCHNSGVLMFGTFPDKSFTFFQCDEVTLTLQSTTAYSDAIQHWWNRLIETQMILKTLLATNTFTKSAGKPCVPHGQLISSSSA